MDFGGLLEYLHSALWDCPNDRGNIWVRCQYRQQLQRVWGLSSLVMRGQLQLDLDWVMVR
jgi:hypothetical protein